MKLVVTGAGGFLGAAVCAAAMRVGHEVVAVARRADPERLRALSGRVALRTIDVADTHAMERLFAAERPDVIVHAAWAGLASADRDTLNQLDQMQAFCRLVEAAACGGVRKVVGIGSQAEYGSTTRRIDEAMLPRPLSLYGAAKLSAGIVGERIAARVGIEFAWLRVFAIYGPGDNPIWLIPNVLAGMLRGERPRLTPGTQSVDYLFIDDAASAALAVATMPGADGVFNLASGVAVTVRDLVERLRDLAAPGMELAFGDVPFGSNQIMHIEGAIDALCNATGWRPTVSLDAGLVRTVDAVRRDMDDRDRISVSPVGTADPFVAGRVR